MRGLIADDLLLQFQDIARLWSGRHGQRRVVLELVAGCLSAAAWGRSLALVRSMSWATVACELMDKVSNTSVLHLDLLNFLILVSCVADGYAILVEHALGLPVVGLDGALHDAAAGLRRRKRMQRHGACLVRVGRLPRHVSCRFLAHEVLHHSLLVVLDLLHNQLA